MLARGRDREATFAKALLSTSKCIKCIKKSGPSGVDSRNAMQI